jgi:hypothetical protein
MTVGELIQKLQEFDPSIVVVEDGTHCYDNQFDSSNVTVTPGYFVRYEVDGNTGLFVQHEVAHQRQRDRKKLLDFTSPNITPGIKLHWKYGD